jgi:DNA topoisomerase-1
MSQLLIVESPTKAKTIKKFLGSAYQVVSSFGHIRDLPKKSTGVDVEHGFKPTYEVPTDKKAKVQDLKQAAKSVDEVYLATDEDREGEAIAWHIAEVLGIDPKEAKRITFHEITKHAIDEALKHPRHIEMPLVHAQQARRILDRLVGYELSPLLWNKVRRGLSAGRVQSVAVRLIVERERERQAFKAEEYWTVDGLFKKDESTFEGKLVSIADKKLEKMDLKTAEETNKIVSDVTGAEFKVVSVEKKKATRKPPTPLTTSALQQEANHRLGFSAKQTMTLAQKLYETGRITYMRTDSQNLAEKYLTEAQAYITSNFGPEYATGVKTYATKAKGAQEAHEAIRPTDVAATPESLKGTLEIGQWKLYDLIWRRTLGSQLPSAILERTAVDIKAKDYTFRANGSAIDFDGFMKVYRSATEKFLPPLSTGETVIAQSITPNQHFTEPPPRYSDATLIKILEEHGIGRPSTYAPTISTIIDRGYIAQDENKRLFPKDEIAYVVTDLLVEHFPKVVDYEFTAKMEKDLDEVADGQIDWVPMLADWYGPFHDQIKSKGRELKREDIIKPRELGTDPKTGLIVVVRGGRFGPFVQLGDKDDEATQTKIGKPKMASLRGAQTPETVILEEALELLAFPKTVGQSPEGEPVSINFGPYGPYIKIGKKNASIPPEIDPTKIDLTHAFEIFKGAAARKAELAKPIAELGTDPTGTQILVKNGRFGPYVTDGKTNVTVPKAMDPLEVTLEKALEMLEKKRTAPPRKWRGKAKKE